MNVQLLTEHHLEFLSLKGDCIGSPESTLVKKTHCWKSHVMAHIRNGGKYHSGFREHGDKGTCCSGAMKPFDEIRRKKAIVFYHWGTRNHSHFFLFRTMDYLSPGRSAVAQW